MNLFLNQYKKESIRHNNNLYTKIKMNEIHIYKGSLQELRWKNQHMEVSML